MEAPKEQAIQIFKGVLSQKAQTTADVIISNLIEGKSNPIYIGVILKKFAKIQELVNKNREVSDLIIEETSKYFESKSKTIEMFGAKITVANTGYWDYSNTEDPYLQALEEINSKTSELIKARKEEIQAKAGAWESINTPGNIVSFGIKPFNITWDNMPFLEWEEAAGEISTNPPTKKGRETLRYTL